jgi:hypothetical protein
MSRSRACRSALVADEERECEAVAHTRGDADYYTKNLLATTYKDQS